MTARGIAVAAALLASGCATTALEQRITRLEQENAALRGAAPATRVRAVLPPAALAQPPYVATVDYKPPTCANGLCVEIANWRPHDVVALAINGDPVLLQGRTTGGRIPPRSSAYVRVPTPGRYVFAAQLHDRIPMPGGRALAHAVLRETCTVTYDVGGVGDDAPRLAFEVLSCHSPIGKL